MSFNDSIIEGEIGENLYIDYLKDNEIKFIDVRSDELCQWLDIDFIIPKGNHTKQDVLKNIRNGNPTNRSKRQQEIGYAVEVKLDKVTHNRFQKRNGEISNGTGNLVYELISHNMPGCLARCYADFVLYICIDTFDTYAQLKKAYMINLSKWRESIINQESNVQLKKLKWIYEKGEKIEENVLNILQPVSDLIKIDGVIKDFTEKLEKFFPKNLIISK